MTTGKRGVAARTDRSMVEEHGKGKDVGRRICGSGAPRNQRGSDKKKVEGVRKAQQLRQKTMERK